MSGEARRRKQTSTKKKEKQRSSSTTSTGGSTGTSNTSTNEPKVRRQKQDKQNEEESLWKTFTSHPLIQALPWLMLLFAFQASKQGIAHVTLRYPHIVNKILPAIDLRPSIGPTDMRQVLIVGTLGSGIADVASELSTKLTLEVGHGSSDALSSYVRDGTVSWFHAIRFLPQPKNMNAAIVDMCKEAPHRAMDFHPRLFTASTTECSNRDEWSTCWAKECVRVLQDEWGCARWDDGCTTVPFGTVLHQIMNPLSVIEHLVATYCEGDAEFENDDDVILNGAMRSSFVTFSNSLFTDGENSFTDYSCIEGASYHVIEYTKAMLTARDEGLINEMYKVEESSPCDVAELAGFKDKPTALYQPNWTNVVVKCAFALDPAREPITVAQQHTSGKNAGQVLLEWSDFEGGKHGSKRKAGDMKLVVEMKQLMETLGYDPDNKREVDGGTTPGGEGEK